jgi:hypothetical protein
MLKFQEKILKKLEENLRGPVKKFFKSRSFATFKFKFHQIYRNGPKDPLKFIDMAVSSKRTR